MECFLGRHLASGVLIFTHSMFQQVISLANYSELSSTYSSYSISESK